MIKMKRKLHKSTASYLVGQPRAAVSAALRLAAGEKRRNDPAYHKGTAIMPWEVEVASGGSALACYPVEVEGNLEWRTAPWIVGVLAAGFCGEHTEMRLYGEQLTSDLIVDYLQLDKGSSCGCVAKLAVCGGVWIMCAPFPHDEAKQHDKIIAEFADGFTTAYGPSSERLLI